MKVIVQVIVQSDDEQAEAREVFHLQRDGLAPENLGLQLGEAKDLLAAVQDVLVDEQTKTALAAQVACPQCGTARRHKDKHTIVLRSLFGTLRLRSPRWFHCPCSPHETRSFSPLAALLPERATPELVYLEAKFAGLVSYGLSAKLLAEVLPLGRPLHPTAVRQHTQAIAERLEDELGPEQWAFIDSCPAEWAQLHGRTCPSSSASTAATGRRVHSRPASARHGGRSSKMVTLAPCTPTSSRTWS